MWKWEREKVHQGAKGHHMQANARAQVGKTFLRVPKEMGVKRQEYLGNET